MKISIPSFDKLGFYKAFFLVLFALKMTDKINWSWWIVSMPLWFPVFFWFLFSLGAWCIIKFGDRKFIS